MSIRDEVSKIIDMRIPQGGFRRYLKEVDRTGGLNGKHIELLIATFEAIEALEKRSESVVEVTYPRQTSLGPVTVGVALGSTEITPTAVEHLTNLSKVADLTCEVCDRTFKAKLGLISHKRTHAATK